MVYCSAGNTPPEVSVLVAEVGEVATAGETCRDENKKTSETKPNLCEGMLGSARMIKVIQPTCLKLRAFCLQIAEATLNFQLTH